METIVAAQRAFFATNATKPIAFRIAEWDSCIGGAYQLKAGFYEWLCANTCTRGEDVLAIRAFPIV